MIWVRCLNTAPLPTRVINYSWYYAAKCQGLMTDFAKKVEW